MSGAVDVVGEDVGGRACGEVLASVEVHLVVVSCAVSSGRSARWVSYAGLAVLELPGVIEFITHPQCGPALNSTRTAEVAVENTRTTV